MNFLFGLLLFGAAPALAQSPYSRIELGAQTSVMTGNYDSGLDSDFGFGGRFTYNFSRYIALDTQLDFYPSQHRSPDFQEGGQRLAGFAGMKAGWRRNKFGLFWKVRPGFLSFSEVPELNTPEFRRVTHLALDLGGVLELYPSRRILIRIDAGEMLARYGERTTPLTPGAFLIAPGEIAPFFQTSVGLSYRIGDVREQSSAELSRADSARHLEIGGEFGWLGLPGPPPSFELRDNQGVGGRFTYNLRPWLGLDARLVYFYRGSGQVGFQEGGDILQGFFGPKVGIRGRRVGAFLKFEPGFTSYDQSDNGLPEFLQNRFVRSTHFSFDAGGVFEVYPSSRTVLRFDAGEVNVFYGKKTIDLLEGGTAVADGYHHIGIAVSTSFAWRF
jgi:hypothetical protein